MSYGLNVEMHKQVSEDWRVIWSLGYFPLDLLVHIVQVGVYYWYVERWNSSCYEMTCSTSRQYVAEISGKDFCRRKSTPSSLDWGGIKVLASEIQQRSCITPKINEKMTRFNSLHFCFPKCKSKATWDLESSNKSVSWNANINKYSKQRINCKLKTIGRVIMNAWFQSTNPSNYDK